MAKTTKLPPSASLQDVTSVVCNKPHKLILHLWSFRSATFRFCLKNKKTAGVVLFLSFPFCKNKKTHLVDGWTELLIQIKSLFFSAAVVSTVRDLCVGVPAESRSHCTEATSSLLH